MTAAERLLRCADVRRANFPDVMDFYAPGLKRSADIGVGTGQSPPVPAGVGDRFRLRPFL